MKWEDLAPGDVLSPIEEYAEFSDLEPALVLSASVRTNDGKHISKSSFVHGVDMIVEIVFLNLVTGVTFMEIRYASSSPLTGHEITRDGYYLV
jgi:hypothetical protein